MSDEQKPSKPMTETAFDRKMDARIAELARRQTPVERASAALATVPERIHGTRRPKSGYALIAVALAIESVELGKYWLTGHPLHVPPQIIAAVIGFIGFYIRNPKQTKDGAMTIVDLGTRLIAVVRTGKRAGDVKAVEVEKPKDGEGQ